MKMMMIFLPLILHFANVDNKRLTADERPAIKTAFNKTFFIEISRRPDRFYNKQLLA